MHDDADRAGRTDGWRVPRRVVGGVGADASTDDSVSYERCVRDHVIPHLGAVRLRDLAPEHVRSWQAVLLRTPRRFRDGPLSTTTVRYCHRLLRRALQDALRWDLIDRNVCDAVVAPRRADTEMTVWSPPDVRRFLAFVADDRLVAMWRLFLVTGMRRGEIAGLRWIDVDLEAGRLSVQHTRVLVYDRAQVSEPKTKRSRRVIALDAGTVAVLRAHRERQAGERAYAQDVWAESGYVFVREDGTPMDPDRISHLFRVAVDAAGLPEDPAARHAPHRGVARVGDGHPPEGRVRASRSLVGRDHARHVQPPHARLARRRRRSPRRDPRHRRRRPRPADDCGLSKRLRNTSAQDLCATASLSRSRRTVRLSERRTTIRRNS